MTRPRKSKPKGRNPLVSRCEEVLAQAWDKVLANDEDYVGDERLEKTIKAAVRSKAKSYRYVLPTQLVAKMADHTLDSRCIQAGRPTGTGNFDARSVNEQVIVPFDRQQGQPLGGSTQPYVNNPLRVPEVSATFRDQQKNKGEWDNLCEILAAVEQREDPSFTSQVFHQTLREIRRLQEELTVHYPIPRRMSLDGLMTLLSEFLEPRTGGRRLQAATVALFRALQEHWGVYDSVTSAPVTAPDAPGARSADVECRKGEKIVLAVEVKDRTVTLELLTDKITSSRMASVDELMFLVRGSGLVSGDDVMEKARSQFASGLSVYLFESDALFRHLLGLLGEPGRRVFLEQIGQAMHELKLDYTDKRQWASLLSRL